MCDDPYVHNSRYWGLKNQKLIHKLPLHSREAAVWRHYLDLFLEMIMAEMLLLFVNDIMRCSKTFFI